MNERKKWLKKEKQWRKREWVEKMLALYKKISYIRADEDRFFSKPADALAEELEDKLH